MRSKLSVALLVATITLVISLVVPGCSSSNRDTSLADVKKRGTILVATDDTYPPLEWNDNGKIVGFDIDLMTEIASRLGVKAEFISTKWDGLLTGLVGKQYDAVISSMNITPKREEQANFVEYAEWAQVIVVSPNAEPIKDLKGLEGKRIAVQISTTSEELAKSIKDAEVSCFESFDTTFMELKNGRCDAIIIDEPVAMYYQSKDPQSFKITGVASEKMPVGIALHKSALTLKEAISKALSDMRKDGTYDQIYQKWFNK